MNKIKYNNVTEIWAALDKGIKVHWYGLAYHVHSVKHDYPKMFSYRDGECLRATCTSNYFGSILQESDVNACYSLKGDSNE